MLAASVPSIVHSNYMYISFDGFKESNVSFMNKVMGEDSVEGEGMGRVGVKEEEVGSVVKK